MPIRVLADKHHGDLYESLRLLFEKRLGWELYRPIGLDWHREGYWKVWHEEATARQFLSLELTTEWESLRKDWINADNAPSGAPGIYHVPDPHYKDVVYKGITLAAAKEMKFDIVLSSMPNHFPEYERFRNQFCPQAKHIWQAGNHWPVPPGCKNFLNSTKVPCPTGINHVFYHQEFDVDLFKPGPCSNPRSVSSMLHYNGHHYRNDFFTLAAQLPSWTFKEYGAGNRDEAVQPGHMPQAIRDSGFIWHIKNGGDGYGYNIHHATACGRPVIYRGCIVNGQTAGDVLEHMVTGIDLDRVDPHRLPEILEDWARWHDVKSEGVYRRFKQVIDFNNEFEQIKLFLDRLQ